MSLSDVHLSEINFTYFQYFKKLESFLSGLNADWFSSVKEAA